MWWIGTAALAGDKALEVCVTDPEGKPVPGATVMVVDEKEHHRVNPDSGCWSITRLYPPDGHEMVAGDAPVAVRASAPGRALVSFELTWGKPSKIALPPLPAPTDPELVTLVDKWTQANAGTNPAQLHVVRKSIAEALERRVTKERELGNDPAPIQAWCASVALDPARCP